ncbi:hypothetical protein N7470_004049 [Penicillium chermesinum]|nr:hypothetical protein N7470_004049 [Penicillium chermesinum]
MLRSSNRHAYQTPLSPGHDRVDDYIYHEPDWTDNVRRPSFHEDQEDEEPELPRSRAASFDDREGSEWTPSRPPRSKWTRSRARSRGGRATSTPDRTKLREFYDQLERIRALSDSLLSEPWMNFDGE